MPDFIPYMIEGVAGGQYQAQEFFSVSQRKDETEEGVRTESEEAQEKRNNASELTPEEQQQVKELQARDAEVRAHEAAHLAAAGGLAQGGASFEFQRGPDGKNYAVGGHVNIDTSKGRTAEETIQRADQIRAAALAPSDPSGQDMRVAARASAMAQEARAEMREKETDGSEKSENGSEAEAVTNGTSGTEETGTHHSSSHSHVQQCPECLQKMFGQ